MIYEYYCRDCNTLTEIEKKLAEVDRIEFCEKCDLELEKQLSSKVSFRGEKAESNESYYHPALGCVVRSESHARQLAKSKGLVEIGNETQDDLTPKDRKYEVSRRDFDQVFGIGEVRGG